MRKSPTVKQTQLGKKKYNFQGAGLLVGKKTRKRILIKSHRQRDAFFPGELDPNVKEEGKRTME